MLGDGSSVSFSLVPTLFKHPTQSQAEGKDSVSRFQKDKNRLISALRANRQTVSLYESVIWALPHALYKRLRFFFVFFYVRDSYMNRRR